MKKTFMCDMHVHTDSSHDCTASIDSMAHALIEKGIAAFAVTDHCDTQYYDEQNAPARISRSVTSAITASEKYAGRLKVFCGVEMGEGTWDIKRSKYILDSHGYDVVIASVHAVKADGFEAPFSHMDFSQIPLDTVKWYYAKYFDEVLNNISNIPCDVIAHLTCPLRYINGKYGVGINSIDYRDKIVDILDYIIHHNIALEINTSGFVSSFGCIMPDEWIIGEYKKMGGYLITLGSDAHIPENVGCGFANAIQILKRNGFEKAYYYDQHEPIGFMI